VTGPEKEAPRVLVVEDDAHLRRSIVLILTAEGYRVQEAADGEEGLNRCLGGEWACVLTDTMMPRMGGFDMLRKLNERGGPMPPIILVSAAYTTPSPDELRALGIRAVVPKPFAFERLLAAIRSVTAG
jgi:DNA-binding response OmpR family regulator